MTRQEFDELKARLEQLSNYVRESLTPYLLAPQGSLMASPYNTGYTPMMAPTAAPYSAIDPAVPRYIKPEDLPRQPSSSRHHHHQHHHQQRSIDSSAASKTPTQPVVLPPPYRTPENAERPLSKNSCAQTLIPGERLRPRFEDPTRITQTHSPGTYCTPTHHLPVLLSLTVLLLILHEARIRILSPVADRSTVRRTWTNTAWV